MGGAIPPLLSLRLLPTLLLLLGTPSRTHESSISVLHGALRAMLGKQAALSDRTPLFDSERHIVQDESVIPALGSAIPATRGVNLR